MASGEVDCALAGASDVAGHPSNLIYLHQAGLLGPDDYAASGAAYVAMERAVSARRDGRRIHARVDTAMVGSGRIQHSRLAERMGCTFAAEPAIALALACEAVRGAHLTGARTHVEAPS